MSLQLGPYVADLTTHKVSRAGEPVKWGDKASHLFILLLSETPSTISKEQIFNHVWKGRVVTENSLYKTISKLRHELNADDIEIESVFGEGYRIISQDAVHKTKAQGKPINRLNYIWLSGVLVIFSLLIGYFYQQQTQQRLYDKMVSLKQIVAVTKQAFISQINRRNELGELLALRFELNKENSWEKRFYILYDDMNEQERFVCQQTRAYTEGPLLENNQAALQLMLAHPEIIDALPLAQELVAHLTIWLNKYQRVFSDSKKMCLLYVGVEDGAKYPTDFDQQLADWIKENQK